MVFSFFLKNLFEIGEICWIYGILSVINFEKFTLFLQLVLLPHSLSNLWYLLTVSFCFIIACMLSISFSLHSSFWIICSDLSDISPILSSSVLKSLFNPSTEILISVVIFFSSKISAWFFPIVSSSRQKFPVFPFVSKQLIWDFSWY